MARRSAKCDTARAEYIERRSRGEKVNLAELADRLGVNRQTLRNWKSRDKWDEAVKPPKRKRGGQPGNKNSKGKKNAAGSHPGAPQRNKNAEKDGAYSTVFFDTLTDEEKELMEQTPLEVRAALEHEMKILKFRENKILSKIADYEKAEEGAVYLSAVTEITGGKSDITYSMKDSAFKRVQSLQEALYKVQGRIAKITDSLRGLDENAARLAMERERLDILRMRASGSVDVGDLEESGDVQEKELEDVTPEKGGPNNADT